MEIRIKRFISEFKKADKRILLSFFLYISLTLLLLINFGRWVYERREIWSGNIFATAIFIIAGFIIVLLMTMAYFAALEDIADHPA